MSKNTTVPKASASSKAPAPAVPASAGVEKSRGSTKVFVFANLPHGQSFMLPGGRRITVSGYPVSELVGQHGEILPAGRFGVTEVAADDWDAVQKLYGKMTVLKSGLIFSAASEERGEVMAAERSALRHGLEQVDPEATATKPQTGIITKEPLSQMANSA